MLEIGEIFNSPISPIVITLDFDMKKEEIEKNISPGKLLIVYGVCLVLIIVNLSVPISQDIKLGLMAIINLPFFITFLVALLCVPVRLIQAAIKKDKRYLKAGLLCGLIPLIHILLTVAIIAAEEQGYDYTQFNPGGMYLSSKVVPKGDAEAFKWYREAAEHGDAGAQFSLGKMYDNGKGIPENDVEAVKWYRKAAEQGEVNAQHNLGVHYYHGEGVTKDYILSYMWFNLAAAQGAEDAHEAKSIISKEMTREQIAEAQKRSFAQPVISVEAYSDYGN